LFLLPYGRNYIHIIVYIQMMLLLADTYTTSAANTHTHTHTLRLNWSPCTSTNKKQQTTFNTSQEELDTLVDKQN